ncbi:MAG TPA: class I SAM-dependent methyltransferase, partial [Pirellulales bacterium]|nr:class I SAM-dependent methyltransferase [Pirellulales bacterium]
GIWETFTPIEPHLLPLVLQRLDHLSGADRRPATEMERFRHAVTKLILEGRPVKLYCGAGLAPRSGFINLDRALLAPRFALSNSEEYVIFPFVDWRWPIPDDCVDYIFHEGFIERISRHKQIQFLAQARRVLKPGGWHRVITPSRITALMPSSDFPRRFTGVYTGDGKSGPISLLTPSTLREIAELAGYSKIVFTGRNQGRSPYAEPDLPQLAEGGPTNNIFVDLLK